MKFGGCTASRAATNKPQIVYELTEKMHSSLDLIEKIMPRNNIVYELTEIDSKLAVQPDSNRIRLNSGSTPAA